MEDKSRQFWEAKLKDYGTKDWIHQPSIFLNEAFKYFPSGGSVLELAGGQGQDSRYLAKQGFVVTFTDRSDFGLEEARQKSQSDNITLTYKQVDLAEPLPFSDEQFDVVYAHMGLHYFTKKHTKELFKEIHRVLKPNGVFATILNTRDDPEIIENKLEEIEENYFYERSTGLKKRYFSIEEIEYLIQGIFRPLLLDTKGHTYKDGDLGLVRLIAHKQ